MKSCQRSHEAAVQMRPLLSTGTGVFDAAGKQDQCRQNVTHHPGGDVVGVLVVYHWMLAFSRGGCYLASQFEARQLLGEVQHPHPFSSIQ